MKVLVVFIFSLLYSFMAHSACNETSCTTQIKRLYLTSNSAADIYIEPADNGIVDC